MVFLVTITGSTGRLGQVVTHLVSKKYKTRLIVRNVTKAEREFPRSKLISLDLSAASIPELRRAVRGSTVVIHLVGLVDLLASRKKLFAVNFEITKKLVAACEAERIPFFLHASSISIYADSDKPINEESEKNPVTIYGESKLAAEQIVARSNLKWVALRPGIIYGPHFKEGFWPLLRQMKKRRAAIIGSGDNCVPLVYEDDVAKAFVKCVEELKKGNKKILRQAFNIVGEHPTQREAFNLLSQVFNVTMPTRQVSVRFARNVASVISFLYKFFGKTSAFPPEYVDLLARSRVYDTSKAKQLLRFNASTPVKQGMREIRKAWLN